ncbi:MAG: hypothetical protein AAGU77_06340, partial [Bacillota bacterium]
MRHRLCCLLRGLFRPIYRLLACTNTKLSPVLRNHLLVIVEKTLHIMKDIVRILLCAVINYLRVVFG